MVSKDEERKALAKIKAIVDGLGNDSYVAMAFDGAFEIAEDNINNDFANSVKYYKEKVNECEKKIKGLGLDLQTACDSVLTLEQLTEIRGALMKYRHTLWNKQEDMAKTIVAYSMTPTCDEFKVAAQIHDTARKEYESATELVNAIDVIRNKIS